MKKLKLLLIVLIFLFSVIVTPKSVFAGDVPESSSGNTNDNWFFESIPYNVTFNSTLNGHTAVSDPSYDAPVVGPYGYLAPTQTYLLGQTVTVKFRIRNQASSTKTIRGYLSYFVMSNLNNGDTTSCNLSPNFNYINKPNLDPGVDESSLFWDHNDRNYSGYSCQVFSGYGTGPSGGVLSDWTVGPDQIAEVTFNFTPTQAGYYQWDVPFGPWCRNDWSNVTPASASSTSSPCDSGSSQQSVAGFIRVIKPNDAKCVNITPPSGTIISGNNYSASVTMENLGHNPWTVGGGYRLGSTDPLNNTLWGLNRANLSSTVNPYTNASFNFNVTAPAAGTQSFNWQMVQDGVGWFGARCTSTVTVVTPSPTATLSPVPLPQTLEVNCLGSPTTALTGETITWTANARGGTGSYIYSWSGTDNLTGYNASVDKSYYDPGTKTASVTVTSGSETTPPKACSSVITVYEPTPAVRRPVISSINIPQCIDSGYGGSGASGVGINLAAPNGADSVAIGTTLSSLPFSKRVIYPGYGTVFGPFGFSGIGGQLTLNPNTRYYVRALSSYANSTTSTFSIPACSHYIQLRAFVDKNGNGVLDRAQGDAEWQDNSYPLTVNLSGNSVNQNCTITYYGCLITNLLDGAYTATLSLPAAIASDYLVPNNNRRLTVSGANLTTDFAIQPLPPPTATPALSPYFQTLGGDVHSNENIQVNH